jgi:hypothetical protein
MTTEQLAVREALEKAAHRRSFEFATTPEDAMGNPRANTTRASELGGCFPTFPTAASPSSTSLTLLLGFGCEDASAMAGSSVGMRAENEFEYR